MTTDVLDAPPAEAPKYRVVSKVVDDHNADTGEFQEMWLVALSKEIPFRMNDDATSYGMTDHVLVAYANVHKAFGVEEFDYAELAVVPADSEGRSEHAFIYKALLTNGPFPHYPAGEDSLIDPMPVLVAMFNIGMY